MIGVILRNVCSLLMKTKAQADACARWGVYISDDCGANWTRIFANGPDGMGAFETSPTTAEPFVPQTEEDWCGAGYGSACTLIDLTDWIGATDVKLMFESYCMYGNNLYVDNVLVSSGVGIIEPTTETHTIDIIPNPTTGIFDLRVTDLTGKVDLRIMNLQGQSVFSETIGEVRNNLTQRIDLSAEPKGIYFVEIRTQSGSEVRKLVLR